MFSFTNSGRKLNSKQSLKYKRLIILKNVHLTDYEHYLLLKYKITTFNKKVSEQ